MRRCVSTSFININQGLAMDGIHAHREGRVRVLLCGQEQLRRGLLVLADLPTRRRGHWRDRHVLHRLLRDICVRRLQTLSPDTRLLL